MWSITPVSSGPCSSPGFMKPTNSQVSVAPAMRKEVPGLLRVYWEGLWETHAVSVNGPLA